MTDSNRWVDPKPRKSLNDLQALRTEIAASVGGDPGNLGQRIVAMVEEKLTTLVIARYDHLVSFTKDLCNTLVAWGMEAVYEPQADPYRQVILTYDGGEPFFTVTVISSDYSIAVLGMVCRDVDDLLTRLPGAIQERREYRMHLRAKYARVRYCIGCWYSDKDVQYCDQGRVMEGGCIHKLDNQQPYGPAPIT